MFEIPQLQINARGGQGGPSAAVSCRQAPIDIALEIGFGQASQRDAGKKCFELGDGFEFRDDRFLGFCRQIALSILFQVVGHQQGVIVESKFSDRLLPFGVGQPAAQFRLGLTRANTPEVHETLIRAGLKNHILIAELRFVAFQMHGLILPCRHVRAGIGKGISEGGTSLRPCVA